MNKKIILFATACVLIVGAITGAAIAGNPTSELPSNTPTPRESIAKLADLPVFDHGKAISELPAAENQLEVQIKDSPSELLLSKLDLATARALEAPGLSDGDVVTALTVDGKGICILTRQFETMNPDAYASGCGTLEEFNTSGISMLNAGPDNRSLLVSIQGPGVASATIERSDGSKSSVPAIDGATIALVDGSAVVDIGSFRSSTDVVKK